MSEDTDLYSYIIQFILSLSELQSHTMIAPLMKGAQSACRLFFPLIERELMLSLGCSCSVRRLKALPKCMYYKRQHTFHVVLRFAAYLLFFIADKFFVSHSLSFSLYIHLNLSISVCKHVIYY